MPRVDGEAEVRLRGIRQTPEHLRWGLDHDSAVCAHEVGVGLARQQVARRTVAEMTVGHDAQHFELIEIAVDRREVRVGVRRAALRDAP